MPALDDCHGQIVNALLKHGWSVDDKPYFLRVESMTLFADIRAQRRRGNNGTMQQIIIVEVKCFPDHHSDQDELYRAIGQYVLYRNGLKARGITILLYLAIPTSAYSRIFSKTVVSTMVSELQIKLIVVNLETEEIIEWLD